MIKEYLVVFISGNTVGNGSYFIKGEINLKTIREIEKHIKDKEDFKDNPVIINLVELGTKESEADEKLKDIETL